MNILTLKHQKCKNYYYVFFLNSLRECYLLLCLKAFRPVEVFNVLVKLFRSEGPTKDKAFCRTVVFRRGTFNFWCDEHVRTPLILK